MKNRFLVGFTSGFLLAYIGEILVDSTSSGFLGEIVLLLIGSTIIAFLWFIRKQPENNN